MMSFFKKGFALIALAFVMVTVFAPVGAGMSSVDAGGHIVFTANIAHADETASNALDCSDIGWDEIGKAVKCGFRWVIAGLMSIPIYFLTVILRLVAQLFDLVMYYTVISFSSFYSTGIESAVNTAWTAFRDIANILIIGIFVFIAIAIILGLETFGKKKYVATLLVVAVLINFSLLFTKIIFDASNFTADQFYTAIQRLGGQNCGSVLPGGNNNTSTGQTANISCPFMKFSGIITADGSVDITGKLTSEYDKAGGGFGAMFLHAFMMSILCFGLIVVFMYGTYLLVARAVLIVFLLVTSSLAAAAMAIPASKGADKWSKMWLDGVKHNAILAPLLMLFLWVSAMVAIRLSSTAGSLNTLESGTPGTTGLTAFFDYLVVLGLLYVSFYAASSLTKQMKGSTMLGMNWAGDKSREAMQWFGGKIGAGVGATGMYTIGKFGSGIQRQFGKWASGAQEAANNKERSGFSRSLFQGLANVSNLTAQGGKRITQQSFNPAQTGAGKAMGLNQGQKGGLEAARNEAAKSAAEFGKAVGKSKDTVEKEELSRMSQKDSDTVVAGAWANEFAKSQQNAGTLAKQIENLTSTVAKLNDRKNSAKTTDVEKRNLTVQIESAQGQIARKQTELTAEKNKIENAKKSAQVNAVLRSNENYAKHRKAMEDGGFKNADGTYDTERYLNSLQESGEIGSLMKSIEGDGSSVEKSFKERVDQRAERISPAAAAEGSANSRIMRTAPDVALQVGAAVVNSGVKGATLGMIQPNIKPSSGGVASKQIADAARSQAGGSSSASSKKPPTLAERLRERVGK